MTSKCDSPSTLIYGIRGLPQAQASGVKMFMGPNGGNSEAAFNDPISDRLQVSPEFTSSSPPEIVSSITDQALFSYHFLS